MDTSDLFQGFAENPDKYMIGLDDTFQFKCRGGGKCCKQRDDILLGAKDLFEIAKHFGKQPKEILKEYCEYYIGSGSRIPIVHLRPQGINYACPFLIGKRCEIHDVKPAVCALYPLGRTILIDPNTNNYKTGYLLQPAQCGSITRTYTVRRWLERFNIPVEDEYFVTWSFTMLYKVSTFIRDMEKKVPMEDLLPVEEIILNLAYLNYDISREFMPQFKRNMAWLENLPHAVQEFFKNREKEKHDGSK